MQYNHKAYKKKSQSFVKEIGSSVLVYEHKKTLARVVVLLNDDEEKVFSASFKTLPEDDTGVAHILEHSVFCGSKKYNVKEPFAELLKSSLNTFLNAMTFPDKTVYPIASCNDDDFKNLVNVYLDAVFNPNLSGDTFMQEGWRYDLDKNDKLSYQGVVFNEMKGVFSSPESYLELAKNRLFYKGTQYEYESGGYPQSIVELTYQDLLDFYRKHYHPSNSYIYFYGNLDLEFYLNYLDEQYLRKYELLPEELPIVRRVEPWRKPKSTFITYPIDSHQDLESQDYLLWSFLLEKSTDLVHTMSFGILNYILLGSTSSVLRNALLESGLCDNTINDGFDNYTYQTSYNFGVKKAKKEDKAKIEKIIFETLSSLVANGIDKQLVEAAFNRFEFKFRESGGALPKGIEYNIYLLSGWLHNADVEKFLSYESSLDTIKKYIERGGYFESLIEKYLLKNPSYLVTIATPEVGFNDKANQIFEKKLVNYRRGLDKEQFKQFSKDIFAWQERLSKQDSDEDIVSIPSLGVESVDRKLKFKLPEKEQVGTRPVYYTLRDTSSICYFDLAFQLDDLSEKQLEYFALFFDIYLHIGSKNYTPLELNQQFDLLTGGFSLQPMILTTIDEKLQTYALLKTSVKFDKLEKLLPLFKEVFFAIDFTNKNKIFELLKVRKNNLHKYLQVSGEKIAISCVQEQLCDEGKFNKRIGGKNLYDFISGVLENFEQSYEILGEQFIALQKQFLDSTRLSIAVVCQEEHKSNIGKFLKQIVNSLPCNLYKSKPIKFKKTKKQAIGFKTQNSVQYVAKGVSLEGFENISRGKFIFINQILRMDYLWNQVRVKNGAYGCFIRMGYNQKSYIICSYRDPNLSETLMVYDKIANYLRTLCFDQKTLEKWLISVIGLIDRPITPKEQGAYNLNLILQGFTQEMLQQERNEIFDFSLEDIGKFVALFEKLAKQRCISVHGSQEKIDEAKGIFDVIKEL